MTGYYYRVGVGKTYDVLFPEQLSQDEMTLFNAVPLIPTIKSHSTLKQHLSSSMHIMARDLVEKQFIIESLLDKIDRMQKRWEEI